MEARRAAVALLSCCQCGLILPAPPPETCPTCGTFQAFLPFVGKAPEEPTQGRAIDASTPIDPSSRLISTGNATWDDALSGAWGSGFARGSSVLVSGPAGSLKTTRLGALADQFASRARARALFISAEQPSEDAQALIVRVHQPRKLLILGAERDGSRLDVAMAEVVRVRPCIVIYDSLQCFEAGGAGAGTATAVTTALRTMRMLAMRTGHVAVIVSRCNARGRPEGPANKIFDCDVVIRLSKRNVTVEKNRFGRAPRTVRLPPTR